MFAIEVEKIWDPRNGHGYRIWSLRWRDHREARRRGMRRERVVCWAPGGRIERIG